jgi:hypothetical protein
MPVPHSSWIVEKGFARPLGTVARKRPGRPMKLGSPAALRQDGGYRAVFRPRKG